VKVELDPEELQLIIDALDDKHNAHANSGEEVLSELQAVNRLYNRLSELSEEHETSRLETRLGKEGFLQEYIQQIDAH
jgi:flagellar motor switch protein FliG